MFYEIWSYVGLALAAGMCGVILYFLVKADDDRAKEEEAREYFDAHGHWPDEA
jgi:hypothetical protein